MTDGRDVGFSWKKCGKAGSGTHFPDRKVIVPHCQEMGGNGSSVKILRLCDKTVEMLDNKQDKMKS